MARILWGSEQPTRPTGYAVVSREIVKRLVADYGHEVFVMGWDHNGENIPHPEGWTMVHAGIGNFGGEPVNHSNPESPTVLDVHLHELKPDLYLSLIDPWFIGHAVLSCNRARVPYIAHLPVDGFPISYQWNRILSNLHTPLWMADYGKDTFAEFVRRFSSDGDAPEDMKNPELDRYLEDAGPRIHHGVDHEVFKPATLAEKETLRSALGITWETTFISVGRNTNRKQIPRLLDALALALERDPKADIGLILHCGDPTDTMGMGGWNLPDLVKQKGLLDRVRFSDSSSNPLHGLSREELARLYQVADVHVLATGGEGFGVPSLEAMSCGLPIILPDNSTGPELVGDDERGWLVPSCTHITGPKWGVNMSLVDVDALADALLAARDPAERRKKAKVARKWVEENMTWDIIAKQFHDLIEATIDKQTPWGMD
jgi:D-inositol-3-phosphate glycosyltransferase